jgi:enoyl-CoA hydratase/carnithine racemase
MAPLAAHAATSAAGSGDGPEGIGSHGAVTATMIAAEMPVDEVSLAALIGAVTGTSGLRPWPTAGVPGALVVDLDARPPAPSASGSVLPALHGGVRAVVVGLTTVEPAESHPAAGLCDVVLPPSGGASVVDAVVATVEASPLAATALAVLLRGAPHRRVDSGLAAESAVYSTLQAGPEFAAWRASRTPRRRDAAEGDPVRVERDGDVLTITLDRPHVRNALSTAMRDQLVEAFDLVTVDPSIVEVHLRGAGPDFCAGGDLDEFGTFPDPATAHLVRLQQSVGRSIATVAGRVTAHLHGACVGSGIELPAFAGTVVAAPDTRISLPEVALGLVPGAGGTVSLPLRIGRHRTARLALTREVLDAATAHAWGLVDAVADG